MRAGASEKMYHFFAQGVVRLLTAGGLIRVRQSSCSAGLGQASNRDLRRSGAQPRPPPVFPPRFHPPAHALRRSTTGRVSRLWPAEQGSASISVRDQLPPVGTKGANGRPDGTAPSPSLGDGLCGNKDAVRRGLVDRLDVATRTHRVRRAHDLLVAF